MTRNEINLLANQLIYKHSELSMWRFDFNNKKLSFGTCSYRKRKIYLSSYFVDNMTDKGIKDTLIHEIAHALTQGHGHDWVWRRKCIELGGTGNRKSTAEEKLESGTVLSSKYNLVCLKCGYKIPKHKKPKRNCSCGRCNNTGRYNPEYKMQLVENY